MPPIAIAILLLLVYPLAIGVLAGIVWWFKRRPNE